MTTLQVLSFGVLAALAGLFWSPPDSELHGTGLYRRDTPFTADGARGADLLSLFAVLPVTLWAVIR